MAGRLKRMEWDCETKTMERVSHIQHATMYKHTLLVVGWTQSNSGQAKSTTRETTRRPLPDKRETEKDRTISYTSQSTGT